MNPHPRLAAARAGVAEGPRKRTAVLSACLILAGLATPAAWSQEAPPIDSPAETPVAIAPAPVHKDPFNEERIMKVIPDYQTVRDPHAVVKPLTSKQKWQLAWKETVDPFNLASAAMAAGFSQAARQTPKYGVGGIPYAERFGAAVADFGTQNVFSAGLLATLLHQDPRYFRKGPESKIPVRVGYALKSLFVCHNDAGKRVFNASGIFGMMMGIGASNLYYPPASRNGEVMAGRLETSLFGGVVGNMTSEFWPDLQKKFFHKKQPPSASAVTK